MNLLTPLSRINFKFRNGNISGFKQAKIKTIKTTKL